MGVGAAGSMAGTGTAGDVAAARLLVFSSATSRVLPGDSDSSCVHSPIHHSRKLGLCVFMCVLSLYIASNSFAAISILFWLNY